MTTMILVMMGTYLAMVDQWPPGAGPPHYAPRAGVEHSGGVPLLVPLAEVSTGIAQKTASNTEDI